MPQIESLVELFEQTIEKHPNNRLFGTKVEDGRYAWTTYQEFGQLVDAFRAGLAHIGVCAGDAVAVISDNRLEWAVGAYATYTLGARYCPMYEAQLAKDWEYIIADSGAKVVLVADEATYETVSGFAGDIDSVERIIFFEGDEAHADHYANILAAGRVHPAEMVYPSGDDLATFIYTSGTTGEPKGVRLTHKNLSSNVIAALELLNTEEQAITEHDTSLSFLPWAHSFGQTVELHLLFASGAAMAIVDDVSTLVADLQVVRPTLLFSVPRIFNRIYAGVQKKMNDAGGITKKLFDAAMENSNRLRDERERGGKASLATRLKDKVFDKLVFSKVREQVGGQLKYALSGGAALSPEVARFIDNLHITVFEGYGLTETSPLVAANAPGHQKIGSVGRPVPGVEITIRPVAEYPEGTGEVCVRGPNVMQGYHNLPDKTAEVLDEDGTFHTGDLGRVDDDGYLWILGRVKEQYKLENGKYVVPGPIEEQLKLSPFVDQIMIEGTNRPHNVALIVVDDDSLSQWLEEQGIERDGALEHPRVQKLYLDELKRVGKGLKGYELPRKVTLIDQEFTTDNDMLTPSLKLKRRVVLKNYGEMLERLYEEEAA